MYIYEYEFLTFYTVIKCQKVVSINDVKARNSSATILRLYERVRYGRKEKQASVDCLLGYEKVGWLNTAV